MQRLKNTVVSALLSKRLDVNFVLSIASIAVGDRPPQGNFYNPRDPLKNGTFQFQRGIGEFVCAMPQPLHPTWEGTPFTKEHAELLRTALLEPIVHGAYTHLRLVPTRLVVPHAVRPRVSNVTYLATRPPLNTQLARPYRPKPMSIALQFDYQGEEFVTAAIRTLAELRERFDVAVSQISLYPTVQYTWVVDDKVGRALDIAGAEAQRQGLHFAHMGITDTPILM